MAPLPASGSPEALHCARNVLLSAAITALAIFQPGFCQPATAPTAMVTDPCPPRPVPPADPAKSAMLRAMLEPGHPGLAATLGAMSQSPEGKANKEKAWIDARPDWPALCRYRAANTALKDKPDVVFMGDSITDRWIDGDPAFFEKAKAVDRGISGQTSSQMLVRFSDDVIDLHPHVVHILAGTNDIAGNSGPMTIQDYKNNIMAMVDLARAHRIRVVLGAIPPSAAFWWAPDIQPTQMIPQLNIWLKSYAAAQRLPFVDYYTALAASDGSLSTRYSNDGVHPNRDGYAVMGQLALQAIATAKSKHGRAKHALSN